MKLVRQEDDNGCGIAVAAMVTGRSYTQVRDELESPPYRWQLSGAAVNGFGHHLLDHYFEDAGFWLQRRYRTYYHEPTEERQWTNTDRWPCAPWAEVHVAEVTQPSDRGHFVVMDAKGLVLDPLGQHDDLRAWKKISSILGLIRA